MIIFIFISFAFGLPLALYAPDPESLRGGVKPSLGWRIRSAWGTLAIGWILIAIAAATLDGNYKIDSSFVSRFALSRYGIAEQGRIFQFLTANLLHVDLFHLVTNLTALLLLSAYERRVGWRRFFTIFLVAAILSSAGDLLLFAPEAAIMGASTGMCGLAAAYFLDHPEFSRSATVDGLLLVLFMIGIYSFAWPVERETVTGSIALSAHLLGASLGAAYAFFFPAHGKRESKRLAQK